MTQCSMATIFTSSSELSLPEFNSVKKMAEPGPGTQVPQRAFPSLLTGLGVRTLEFQLHSALARPSRALRTRQDSSALWLERQHQEWLT